MSIFFNILASTRKTSNSIPEISSSEIFVRLSSPEDNSITRQDSITLTAEVTGVQNLLTLPEVDYYHFIAYGQSLSGGAEGEPVLSVNQVAGNVMLRPYDVGIALDTPDNLDTFYPLDFNATNPDVSAPEPVESPVLAWANAFKTGLLREIPSHYANNTNIVASSTGKGGMHADALKKEGLYYMGQYYKALEAGKRAADNAGKTIACPAVLYMQGESEGVSPESGTVEEYKSDLLEIFEDMRTDAMTVYGQAFKPVVFVYQPKGNTIDYVKEGYLELIREHDWIIGVSSTSVVPNFGIHLNANGYRWFGEQTAKAMIRTIKEDKRFLPLMPIKYKAEGNKMVITFNKELVIDTVSLNDNTAFSLRGITVTDTLVEGNKVTLTTAVSDLKSFGDIYLSSSGNSIRDNDGYLATTNYVDFTTEKTTYNNMVDENGDVLFGQPYPLWNWMFQIKGLKIQ